MAPNGWKNEPTKPAGRALGVPKGAVVVDRPTPVCQADMPDAKAPYGDILGRTRPDAGIIWPAKPAPRILCPVISMALGAARRQLASGPYLCL
jgi:hypothetical protein